MTMVRLQKIIARGGIASRRAAEQLITEGRVRVNGRVVSELGTQVDDRNDKVEVDGQRVVAETPVYYVLHKPRGFVTTLRDPEGRPTIVELLRNFGIEGRVFPVGRLDFHTSGVLLLTNDGAFSNGMLHPRKAVPKTYVLKVNGVMKQADVQRWRDGIQLEDGRTLPADVKVLRQDEGKTWLEVTLREGRNQQIRRMGEATQFPVMRLARISFAGINHEGLRPGELRPLTYEELVELKKEYGVPRSPAVARLMETPRALPQRKSRPTAKPYRMADEYDDVDRFLEQGHERTEGAAPRPAKRLPSSRNDERGPRAIEGRARPASGVRHEARTQDAPSRSHGARRSADGARGERGERDAQSARGARGDGAFERPQRGALRGRSAVGSRADGEAQYSGRGKASGSEQASRPTRGRPNARTHDEAPRYGGGQTRERDGAGAAAEGRSTRGAVPRTPATAPRAPLRGDRDDEGKPQAPKRRPRR